ncbi:glycosyltransferase family 2 protein [Butyrivibrio sp. INlla14]|uniref:glycosyltransferase family 2 protein n=1 Tax=Butyrivibrio sp. INlla14 TaxID=1520808 RepID=UPI000875F6D2|nr:glycosyltransferase family 2 protein [Butyrivibrio sp. INlla14]SCY34322.1 Glycosyltransferase, GT2 family [Butyrivibrio sp. INlla14]
MKITAIIIDKNTTEHIERTRKSLETQEKYLGETEILIEKDAGKALPESTGDYVLFINSGDEVNSHLFDAIDTLCQQLSDTPDMFSFNLTNALNDFELFIDEPFDTKNASIYYFADSDSRKSFLGKKTVDERIFCHAFKREFLMDYGQELSEEAFSDESVFVYPLLLMAYSVCFIPENGYCRFEDNMPSLEANKRIADNMQLQTALFEMLSEVPEIMNEYGEIIIAHFIEKYYLNTIKLAKALDINNEFSLSVFQALQYACLKIAPKWIENQYIFTFSQHDRELLTYLSRQFSSDAELHDTLYQNGLVTVIIDTYNRAKELPRAINNILYETYQRFEIVVVDDGSSDNTEEAVKRFTDERVKYFKNPQNMGLAASRNVGVKNAKGYYITFQDDDDLCRLEKIEDQVRFLQDRDREIGMTYHETINHINRLENRGSDVIIMPSRNIPDVKKDGYIFPALLPWNFITGPSMMIKKECFEKSGLFDESLFSFEDWEMTLRIVRDFKVGFMKKPLYDYYQTSQGLLFNDNPEHRKKVVAALDVIDKEFGEDRKKYNIDSIKK